jgi:hypothetical protein
MPYDVNIGIDHPFNDARRRHVQMLERTDRLAIRPEVFDYRSMIGGGPLREYALAGQNGAYPLDDVRLEEYKRMGGRFSLGRTLRQVKEAIPASVCRKAYSAAKRVVRPAAERLAANYGLEALVPVGERALDRAVGGKINRLKKAKRWTGFAVDTVSKGLDLGSRAKKLFGYGEMEGCGARKDLPAGTKDAKDYMDGLRSYQDDQSRFVKGSKEAIAYMASIRKKRRTKAELDAERAADRAAEGLPPRKARAPNERAGIVKAVMAERGVSMIQASKIVKSEGLYTPVGR